MHGLAYRNALLDIAMEGAGTSVREVRLDGRPTDKPFVKADATGRVRLEVTVAEGR
jgi:hypothetical protein